MVHRAGIARPDLDRFHLPRLPHLRRQYEIPEDVRTVGGHGERVVGSDDQIGRPELPARSEGGNWRRIRGRTFRSACPHPLLDGFDLRVRETMLAGKIAEARLRQPRWHVAAPCDGRDLRGLLSGIL